MRRPSGIIQPLGSNCQPRRAISATNVSLLSLCLCAGTFSPSHAEPCHNTEHSARYYFEHLAVARVAHPLAHDFLPNPLAFAGVAVVVLIRASRARHGPQSVAALRAICADDFLPFANGAQYLWRFHGFGFFSSSFGFSTFANLSVARSSVYSSRVTWDSLNAASVSAVSWPVIPLNCFSRFASCCCICRYWFSMVFCWSCKSRIFACAASDSLGSVVCALASDAQNTNKIQAILI